jgi:predicted DNA-binding transcriptional regulator YafY
MSATKVHRLLQLINAMRSGHTLSADELALKLGVSRRTVFRDLGQLERSGVPCRYDANRHGYLIDEWYFLPPINLTLSEALGLYVAATKIAGPKVFPLAHETVQAMEKVLQSLPTGLRHYCLQAAKTVEVRWPAMVDTTAVRATFHKLQDAAGTCHKVRMKYDSYYENREINVILHPYVVTMLHRSWYVVGYCEAHKQVRMFNMDRVLSVAVLEEDFPSPTKFSLDSHLRNAWVMIPENKTWSVKLRFTAKVAGNVEEVLWHKTQRTQRLADDTLIFEVDVDGLSEISWWIMGYGDQVCVEKPEELRERVKKMAETIVAQYAK